MKILVEDLPILHHMSTGGFLAKSKEEKNRCPDIYGWPRARKEHYRAGAVKEGTTWLVTAGTMAVAIPGESWGRHTASVPAEVVTQSPPNPWEV